MVSDLLLIDFISIGKLFLATILGSIVGYEREKKHKPAGFRTYMLVSLGSCLITLISISFVDDPSRVASSIVTGIGFLGAGAIIAQGKDVKGLTTAASLWTMAAIGLAVGTGYYLLAIVATLLVYLILKIKFGRKEGSIEKTEI